MVKQFHSGIRNTRSSPALETIPLMYLTAVLAIAAVFIFTRDNTLFWLAHLAFASILGVLAISTNLIVSLIRKCVATLGAIALCGLFVYYAIMASFYPVPSVSREHWAYIYASIGPGFIFGYLTFSRLKLIRVTELAHFAKTHGRACKRGH
jgi:hypothetical protein